MYLILRYPGNLYPYEASHNWRLYLEVKDKVKFVDAEMWHNHSHSVSLAPPDHIVAFRASRGTFAYCSN